MLLHMESGRTLIYVYAVRGFLFSSQLRTHYANKFYANISFVEYTNMDADEWVSTRDVLDGPKILVGATVIHFSRPALRPTKPPIILWVGGRYRG
jgi:hypothetical protein